MKPKKRKINILQVVNGFAIGGGELKLLELVSSLVERRAEKYNVVVCSVGQGGPLQPEFEKLGIKVFVIGKKHKFDISQVFKLYKIIREEKIDIVQTTLFYADVIGALAAKLAGIRPVLSWDTVSHPSDSHETKLRHTLSYRFCMQFVSRIIAVSDAVKNFLVKERKIDPRKIQTIHYGIDLGRFNSRNGFIDLKKRSELGLSENDIVIGTVARLTVQKGHRILVESAPKIVARFPNAHFVFAGDGPLRKDLEGQIEKLGLGKHFHFLGFRQDVSELLYAFDLFVLPSLFEGLPNVILEAMASGRPVVATAVDGTPEVVQHGKTGLLVPPQSPVELSAAVLEVLQQGDKGQGMGKQGSEHVARHFSYEMEFQMFEKAYDEVLNGIELHRELASTNSPQEEK